LLKRSLADAGETPQQPAGRPALQFKLGQENYLVEAWRIYSRFYR